MRIGIIGAGNIGSILARHFRQLEHEVLIANSRGPETLTQFAKEIGALAATASGAANGVDLMVLTIPLKGVPSLPKDLFIHLPKASPIIDTGNYYPPRDGHIVEIDGGMVESEWTSGILGRPVVKAFNNITAGSLQQRGLPKGTKNRIALPVSGENAAAKRQVMDLVEAIGFDAFDAGSLADSWRYQPGTPAYCPDPNTKELRSLLQRADRKKAPKSRDSASKMLGDVVLTFPHSEMVRVLRVTTGLDSFNPRNWLALARLLLAVLKSKVKR